MRTYLNNLVGITSLVLVTAIGCNGQFSGRNAMPSLDKSDPLPPSPVQTEFIYETNYPYTAPVVDVDGTYGSCSFSSDRLQVIYTRIDFEYEGVDTCEFHADYGLNCEALIDFSVEEPQLEVFCII